MKGEQYMSEIVQKCDLRPLTMFWKMDMVEENICCIPCEKLKDYTFYPYRGKLKEIIEYCENKENFVNTLIYIVDYISNRITKVPCYISEQKKHVYITELNFNKYWKNISLNFSSTNWKNGGPYESPQVMNDRVNLSLMKKSNNIVEIGSDFTIKYKMKDMDLEKQRLISKRANAMDDARYRYIYSKKDNIVHDKSCEKVKEIKYWDFEATEKLPEKRKICPCCKRNVYIRNAIKSDMKKFSWFLRFFEKAQVDDDVIEKYLGGGKAELYIENIDELRIKYKEDIWIVKLQANGQCKLKHNNYVIINNEMRNITSGFHDQKKYPCKMSKIFTYIDKYDWHKHLEKDKIVPIKEIQKQIEPVKKSILQRVYDKIKSWIKKGFTIN